MRFISAIVSYFQVTSRKTRIVSFSKALSVSVLNQGVSSGTNFVLGLYLVRVLTPAEFGLYGIGFAISLFYASTGNALFLTQMVVHVPDKTPENRLPYAARMLTALGMFCLLTALASGLLLVLGRAWSDWLAQYVGLGLAITAASVAYLLKDFFVRHSYTARKEVWALGVNTAVAIALAVLLLMQHYSGNAFNSENALHIYAMTNVTGAAVGFFLSRLPLRSVSQRQLLEDAHEAWQGGRWAIGGASTTWVQSQAYTYVTAFFLGPVGVGYANAARMLITPFAMLVPAIDQVTMPRLAELRAKDGEKMVNVGFLITSGLLALATIYSLIIVFAADHIVPLLLGNRFSNLRPLIIAWAVCLVLQLLRGNAGTILQLMKHFRVLTLTNIISAIAAIGCTVLLIKIFGVTGAIIGTGIGDAFLALMLWRIVWNERCNIH
jgi:O-antigen/teichoic acid export membrane protein